MIALEMRFSHEIPAAMRNLAARCATNTATSSSIKKTLSDQQIKIEKVRVTSGEISTGFLGLWTFRDVTVDEPGTLEPERDRILGKLAPPFDKMEFNGHTVPF